jgi:hypothetical protein
MKIEFEKYRISDRHHVHFTPKFDEIDGTGKTYSFFNKPFGVLHWLENAIGVDMATGKLLDENVMVVINDPDQIFLKPIINNFPKEHVVVSNYVVQRHDRNGIAFPEQCTHGHPFGQQYGLGAGWKKFDLDAITLDPNSPAKAISEQDAGAFYPVGPPYMATGRDMYTIVKDWSKFVRPVNKQYPHLLGEMYAYCIAAAHNGLRHHMIDSFMVSNVGAGGEGWDYVDKLGGDVCGMGGAGGGGGGDGDGDLPSLLHFCQMYRVGEFAFHKRKVPNDVFSCDFPLFIDPPDNLGRDFPYKTQGNLGREKRGNVALTEREMQRNAFFVCNLVRSINEASKYFKEHHCEGAEGNFEKKYKIELT